MSPRVLNAKTDGLTDRPPVVKYLTLTMTLTRELHAAVNIPYAYDFTTQLCRQRAKVIHSHANASVLNAEQGEALHRKYKRLTVGDGQAYDGSSD
jgi:hypothetical protein